MKRKILDITKITTLEELDGVDWREYLDDRSWLRFIKYPLSQREMNRVCDLAAKSDITILCNSMGDMHYYERKQIEMKGI